MTTTKAPDISTNINFLKHLLWHITCFVLLNNSTNSNPFFAQKSQFEGCCTLCVVLCYIFKLFCSVFCKYKVNFTIKLRKLEIPGIFLEYYYVRKNKWSNEVSQTELQAKTLISLYFSGYIAYWCYLCSYNLVITQ